MISSTWHFGKRHFGMDILSRRLFSTRTFHQKNILAWVFVGTMDVSVRGRYRTGTFRNKDILGTWTFWNRGTRVEMTVPKCLYCFSWCQNIPMLKCSQTKCPCAKKSRQWNVCAEMTLAKMSGAKIIPSLYFSSFDVSIFFTLALVTPFSLWI